MRVARLSADRVGLFALPFLAMVSVCFLSLEGQLQPPSALWWRGGNTTALAATALTGVTGSAAVVAFVSAMLRTENMLACAACFATVFTARQALLRPAPMLQAAAAVAAGVCVFALVEHCTASDSALLVAEAEAREAAAEGDGGLDTLFDRFPRGGGDDEDGASSSAFSIGPTTPS